MHMFNYTPPAVPGTDATTYQYNLAKKITTVMRPDGQVLNLGYDAAGRLSTQTLPRGVAQYSYSATTGNLSTITAPDGGGLAYTYDGFLPTSEIWSVTVAGSVGVTYDNNFRITSCSVGTTSVNFE